MAVNKGQSPTKLLPRDRRAQDLFSAMQQGKMQAPIAPKDLYQRMGQGSLGAYKPESAGPSVNASMGQGGSKKGRRRRA